MERAYRISVKQKGGWRIGLYDYTLEEANQAKMNIEETARALNKKVNVKVIKFSDI